MVEKKDFSRYDRQMMLPELGEEGQRRLSESAVLIVGVGGLGSPVALYLAAAGVGRIGLADADVVSLTNLQRQVLYSADQLGRSKTGCAAERLNALNDAVTCEELPFMLDADTLSTLVPRYDLVIDCTDNYRARFDIDDACATAGVPWVHGSISGFIGQVSLFGGKAGKHYSDLYDEREELCSLPKAAGGVIGMTPGVVGNIEALEAVKWLAGIPSPLDGAVLTIDLLTYNFNRIEL